MKKRILSLLMAVVMLCSLMPILEMPAKASIYTGKIGNNITWEYDSDTKVMTLSGVGTMADYGGYIHSGYRMTSYMYGVSPKTVVISEGITSIGANRFTYSESIQKVILPSTLVEIRENAFYNCDYLTTVQMTKGIQKIGNHAFYGCDNLETVVFPAGLTYIDDAAFSNCGVLSEINLPEKLTYLGANAFEACRNITKVVIPEGIEEIQRYTFSNCEKLEKIYIPAAVYSVGNDAFASCRALSEIYYSGSETDWFNISFQQDKNSSCCSYVKMAMHYYDCTGPDCVLGDHTEVKAPAVAANCTAPGKTEGGVCAVCGKVMKPQTDIPMLGHDYVATITKTATCSAVGEMTYVCKNDESHIYTEEIPKLAHTVVVDAAVAATCAAPGKTEGKHCSVCNEVIVKQEIIPAKAHAIVIDQAVAATCTASGKTEGKHCGVCNVVLVKQETVPVKEHSYSGGKCAVCGGADPDYVAPTPTPAPVTNPFEDVKDTDWYFDAVLWAVQNSVTGGTSATTFSPENACTRAQIVTFIWAANGRPEPTKTDNPFADVSAADWYCKAVLWAVEQGITGGTSAATFSPDAPCTRAQVVTFLYAAAGKPEVKGGSTFTDVANDAWYAKPVIWAVQNGITSGVGDGKFGSDQTCTRGQIALFLYKAMAEK